jgi:hypothetical protein
MQHLIIEYPFARQVWHKILTWLRLPWSVQTATATSLVSWWQEAKQDITKSMHKGLTSPALLVPRMIWKQRHGCIFKHAQPSVSATTALIKEETLRWAKAGAHGLKV